ncbi:MAG: hypothetical protein U9M92_01830 [Patescibacteria group bacterium]|nr:hypothetical protein [Patescibacteria group bacterium]
MEEVEEDRTTNSREYLLDDGTYESEFYTSPIRYQDGNGDFQEIVTTITESREAGWAYEVTSGIYSTYFANNQDDDGWLAEYEYEDFTLDIQLGDVYWVDRELAQVGSRTSPDFSFGVAVNRQQITYDDVYGSGTSL